MLLAIKRFFEENLKTNSRSSETNNEQRIELATAALLLELIKSDTHIDERETQALIQVLKQTFVLEEQQLTQLVTLAEEESKQATSLYEFTSLINAGYTYEQRLQLLENLWRVAFADSSIDRYEEHLIRKIADLIYVNHSDFIKAKLKVRDDMSENRNWSG